MRVLVLDPFHGAAGDMITGALLDCGAEKESVLRAMRAVVAEPGIATVNRAGIQAVKVSTHALTAHRNLAEVQERLDKAAPHVPAAALAQARRVFERINAAEEEVHGEHVHFHEVGADDAIADVIGACTALHTLNIDGMNVLPITLGYGIATGSHGTFPIPAPATAAILKKTQLATTPGPWESELCTPTGAALLAEFSAMGAKDIGPAKILSVGYGAGSRNPHDAPNVLRAMIVETADLPGELPQDQIDVLETNIDDVTGEVVAHALARFMEEGARDASAIPVIMKKGRPGYLVRVICASDCSARMAKHMARELGTLGIRCTPALHRFIAERTIEEIGVRIGRQTRTMPVKCGKMHGEIYTVKAEFDHAREWAKELGLPVRDVLRVIEETARSTLKID